MTGPGAAGRLAVAAVAAVVIAGLGACRGGSSPALTMDGLAATGDACPVDLDAAIAAAGLQVGAGDVTVEVDQGSGRGGPDASALDRIGGVYVECTRAVEGGDVTAYLVASERPGVVNLFLPLVVHDLGLTSDEAPDVVDATDATDVGEIVDLGTDGPAALARIDVEDAESAALYVAAPEATPPDRVHTLTDDILGHL